MDYSKGVAILFRHNIDCSILSSKEIFKGRALEVTIETDEHVFTIVNVYAPNNFKERSQFFDTIHTHVSTNLLGSDYTVCGDFNVASAAIDKSKPLYADPSRSKFLNFIKGNNIHDIWREHHPSVRAFTWRRIRQNVLIQSRIDKILVSHTFKHCIKSSAIVPFVWSDHDLVSSLIDFSRVTRGEGLWHFNKQLLQNDDFCTDIRIAIAIMKLQPLYETDILKWYDNLKEEFKIISILHAKKMAKEKRKHKKILHKRLNSEYKKAAKYDDYDLSLCKKLELDLHSLEEEECKGAIIRSKIKDIELGEKSNKYFLNLEKFRQKTHNINSLIKNNDVTITTSDEIVQECHDFYSKLFTDEPCDIEAKDSFIDLIFTPISSENYELCKKPISLENLHSALSKMDSNKSPGSDGLTVEFYRFFFEEIGPEFLKVCEAIFENQCLPVSMTQGVITLVPKKGDRSVLKNWRPISLLNIDYKIISKALADRLSKVMATVISSDQTCSVPGRDIADNVLAMRDLVDYISERDLTGFLVKIDQQKAFDRVNHEYMFKILNKFGFPDYFIQWIRLFYSDAVSCVKVNGFLSDFFPISRGIRQGCPLSALLYVLSAEPLRNSVVNHPGINAFDVDGDKALFFQHADDSTAFVRDLNSVKHVFECFDKYNKASGSKVNLEKSEILPLGRALLNPPDDLPCRVIDGPTEVLGIHIGRDKVACEKDNWSLRIDKCIAILKTWKARSLSLKGKVLVVNSLVISRIVYVLNLTNLPNWVVPKLKSAILDFIWSGKRHKIKYSVLVSPIEKGGLGLLDVERMKYALRCKWVKKLFDDEHPLNPITKALISFNLSKYKNTNLGIDVFRIVYNPYQISKLPAFYAEMLGAWVKVTGGRLASPINAAELLRQPLFLNPHILDKKGNSLFYDEFLNLGIFRIKDIIYEYVPGFLPSQTLAQSLLSGSNQVRVDKFLRIFNHVVECIPKKWTRIINSKSLANFNNDNPSVHLYVPGSEDPIDVCSTSTQFFNNLLRNRDSQVVCPAGLESWRNQFGDNALKIPFRTCFGGLKQNYMAEIDFLLAHNCLYTNKNL